MIMSRMRHYSHRRHIMSVNVIMNAVVHLKSGKSDGCEGLCSDHVINVPNRQIVVGIFYLLFLTHDFSSDFMS